MKLGKILLLTCVGILILGSFTANAVADQNPASTQTMATKITMDNLPFTDLSPEIMQNLSEKNGTIVFDISKTLVDGVELSAVPATASLADPDAFTNAVSVFSETDNQVKIEVLELKDMISFEDLSQELQDKLIEKYGDKANSFKFFNEAMAESMLENGWVTFEASGSGSELSTDQTVETISFASVVKQS